MDMYSNASVLVYLYISAAHTDPSSAPRCPLTVSIRLRGNAQNERNQSDQCLAAFAVLLLPASAFFRKSLELLLENHTKYWSMCGEDILHELLLVWTLRVDGRSLLSDYLLLAADRHCDATKEYAENTHC